MSEKLVTIAKWRSSGLSQREFCRNEEMNVAKFNKWVLNEARLLATEGSMKNSKREGKFDEDRELLVSFVRQNVGSGVVDLLGFARRRCSDTFNSRAYITRYVYCRRLLFSTATKEASLSALPTISPVLCLSSIVGEEDADEATATTSGDVEDRATWGQQAWDRYFVGGLTSSTQEYIHTDVNILNDSCPRGETDLGRCGCVRKCGCQCINMVTCEECVDENCSVGDGCGNRWMVPRPLDHLRVFDTVRTGRGLMTRLPIPANTVVVEYCGEYVRFKDYTAWCIKNPSEGNRYYMDCGEGYGIDARAFGNQARFIKITHVCRIWSQ